MYLRPYNACCETIDATDTCKWPYQRPHDQVWPHLLPTQAEISRTEFIIFTESHLIHLNFSFYWEIFKQLTCSVIFSLRKAVLKVPLRLKMAYVESNITSSPCCDDATLGKFFQYIEVTWWFMSKITKLCLNLSVRPTPIILLTLFSGHAV